MSEWRLDPVGDGDDDDAPICGTCGVTALPGSGFAVDDHGGADLFECANDGCSAFGERVAS